jgi:hypothetical protein
MRNTPFWKALLAVAISMAALRGQASDTMIVQFSAAKTDRAPAPWRAVGVPGGKIPLTTFVLTELDGQRVLRVEALKSYGTLVHALPHRTPDPAVQLSWRWRLDKGLQGTDLRQRAGDDSPLKVCASFDLPLDKLGLIERSLLRFARAASDEVLPSATLCYVWDANLPPETLLPNAYTARVRMLVLNSGNQTLGSWVAHTRNVVADFRMAFAGEFDTVPPLTAVLVGGDSDNTGGHSIGYVGDVSIKP